MAFVLQVAVKPYTGFLPQASPVPYSLQTLIDFGNSLKAEGLVPLYRAVLVYMDTAFFSLFALWVIAGHISLSAARLRWIGVLLALLAVALEVQETRMILEMSGLGVPEAVDIDTVSGTSPSYYLTLAKYAAYLACLASMWRMVGRNRTEGGG